MNARAHGATVKALSLLPSLVLQGIGTAIGAAIGTAIAGGGLGARSSALLKIVSARHLWMSVSWCKDLSLNTAILYLHSAQQLEVL